MSDSQKAVKLATIVYALQAASFVVGLTFVAAVIVNYLKRDDVADGWVATHFRWQIRTFWFALLWCFFAALTIPIGIGMMMLAAVAIWVIYRIAKGWLALADQRPMYLQD